MPVYEPMFVFLSEKHSVPNGWAAPGGPVYGVILANKHVQWISCRDEFQKKTPDALLPGFYFSAFINPINCQLKDPSVDLNMLVIDHTVEFLQEIEEKLGVKSQFYCTDRENTIFLVPAPFWLENEARKAFLSAALKAAYCSLCSAKIKGKSKFDLMINGCSYFTSTPTATRYFLDGYTHLKSGWIGGWTATFANKTEKQIETMLARQNQSIRSKFSRLVGAED